MKSVKDVSVCTVYLLWRTTGPSPRRWRIWRRAGDWRSGASGLSGGDGGGGGISAAPHHTDIALPCFDGYHWCRELRKQTSAPILFLSSAGDNMNVIMAMNFGADDFIAKPFDGGVLMAKVQAMLRRSYDMAAPAVLRERRGAQLSADDQKLTYQGQTVELTKNEYRILSCLMESAGKVVSREKLMQRLWETDSFVDENTLTVNVNRLRRKLAGVGLVDFIATRHGVGYIVE